MEDTALDHLLHLPADSLIVVACLQLQVEHMELILVETLRAGDKGMALPPVVPAEIAVVVMGACLVDLGYRWETADSRFRDTHPGDWQSNNHQALVHVRQPLEMASWK